MRRDRAENSNKTLIITLLIIAVILPFAIYFSASYLLKVSPPKKSSGSDITDTSEQYDPGPAWLQTRPIMVPDGRNGYLILRAYLRMVNRDAAERVCQSHPRLADEIQEMLVDRPDVIKAAIEGQGNANKFVQRALEKRVGAHLFTRTVVSQTEQVMMAETDTSRYECHREMGTRLIFRGKKY